MIKIYDNLRVLTKEQKDSVPLAFVIPWEDTKAKHKQLETATDWARSYDYETKKYIPGTDLGLIPNEPQSGFKLARSVRRSGWSGSGNVVWRMEDPRGFEFEISSENMAKILSSVGMAKEGIIPVPCIYGRDGARNVLLPEGTEFYQKAKSVELIREEAKAAKLSVKDVPIGSLVSGPKIDKEIYLGRVQLTSDRPELDKKKFYLFGDYIDYGRDNKPFWRFRIYSGFNVNEIHNKGNGERPEGTETEIHKALGLHAEDMPNPRERNVYVFFADRSVFYNGYDSLEEKKGKIFGLWVNPDKPKWTEKALPNSLQSHNNYYTGCFVRKVTFL